MAEKEWTWRDTGRHEPVLRIANAVGSVLRLDRKPFNPTQLMESAVEKCGLDDFGDGRFRDGLDKVCESFSEEARFNWLGHVVARQRLVDVLASRLKIVDWAKRHPDIAQEEIRKPWIVLGLPRSGTTLTSTLLDLDAHVRSPRVWEVDHPCPPATISERYADPRIALNQRMLKQAYGLMPALPAIHYMDPMMPHECIMLTIYDFRSLAWQGLALAPSYGRWYVNCDMSSAFALHKTILQSWQHEIATRTWSLKAPNHLHAIDYLMASYPDARVIWVHRDPVSCIPSITSLMLTMHRPLTKAADPVAAGEHFNWMYRTGIERTMAYDARASQPTWCFHLHYSELMCDPVRTMRAAYAHFGEAMESEHESRIAAWVRQRPQHGFGRHKYRLEEFGLRREALHEQYADYTGRYSVALE